MVGAAGVDPGLCIGSPELSVDGSVGLVSTESGTWTVDVPSGRTTLVGQEDRHALRDGHALLAASGATEVRLVSLSTGEYSNVSVSGRVVDVTVVAGGYALLTASGTAQFVDVLSEDGEWGRRMEVEGLFTSISGARDAHVAMVVAPSFFTKVEL